MNSPDPQTNLDAYCLLRTAQTMFNKTPKHLSEEELAQAAVQARKESIIENRVLSSPEAAAVIITDEALNNAMQEIKDRYEDEQLFITELAENHLDLTTLEQAVLRQCKVENVLETVASRASKVSEVEVGIYYHMHLDQFQQPELRAVKHILITINDEYPENSRENALKRINEIAAKLKRKPHKFADLAMKNSECPTALQGGDLGIYPKGKLYPEIDAVLFELQEKQISPVIETEAGFHIIRCGKIEPAGTVSLKKAQSKIRQFMQERLQRTCQRAWLASLPATASSQIN